MRQNYTERRNGEERIVPREEYGLFLFFSRRDHDPEERSFWTELNHGHRFHQAWEKGRGY